MSSMSTCFGTSVHRPIQSTLSSSFSINQTTDLAREEHLLSFEMKEDMHLFFSKLLFEKFA